MTAILHILTIIALTAMPIGINLGSLGSGNGGGATNPTAPDVPGVPNYTHSVRLENLYHAVASLVKRTNYDLPPRTDERQAYIDRAKPSFVTFESYIAADTEQQRKSITIGYDLQVKNADTDHAANLANLAQQLNANRTNLQQQLDNQQQMLAQLHERLKTATGLQAMLIRNNIAQAEQRIAQLNADLAALTPAYNADVQAAGSRHAAYIEHLTTERNRRLAAIAAEAPARLACPYLRHLQAAAPIGATYAPYGSGALNLAPRLHLPNQVTVLLWGEAAVYPNNQNTDKVAFFTVNPHTLERSQVLGVVPYTHFHFPLYASDWQAPDTDVLAYLRFNRAERRTHALQYVDTIAELTACTKPELLANLECTTAAPSYHSYQTRKAEVEAAHAAESEQQLSPLREQLSALTNGTAAYQNVISQIISTEIALASTLEQKLAALLLSCKSAAANTCPGSSVGVLTDTTRAFHIAPLQQGESEAQALQLKGFQNSLRNILWWAFEPPQAGARRVHIMQVTCNAKGTRLKVPPWLHYFKNDQFPIVQT